MHEQTFNDALADALRRRRAAWRHAEGAVVSERLQMLPEAPQDRPDIVVMSRDAHPIIIEVEFGYPAFSDAASRLGKLVDGTARRARSAIAVGVPDGVREWSPAVLHERLAQPDGVTLRCAILSANITGEEIDQPEIDASTITYWPVHPHAISASVDDLATLCEYAVAPQQLVSQTAGNVALRIRGIAADLQRSLTGTDAADRIARTLDQRDPQQGLRMACCIWLTSLRLHDQLATASAALRENGLRSPRAIRQESIGDAISISELIAEWDKILEVNYRSIFTPAKRALNVGLPAHAGAQALTQLQRLAEQIDALRLGNRIEFAGELFPELLDDREETAAHYTLPQTAELLACLSVERLKVDDWSSVEEVAALNVADLACGTGALLRAVYHQLRRRHEASGGDADGLHSQMLERSISGLDINALATHMTAAGLSGAEIGTAYHDTRIAAVPVMGGKTGSLELLESEQVTDIIGEQVRSATDGEAQPAMIYVPDKSLNLVIQNPPYSRARGDRKLFDITGITDDQRDRSLARLSAIRRRLRASGNRVADGQAGLGSDFSALADRKLAPGGVFASVLPLTAAHAESWAGFREHIEREYHDVTAIAFTGDETNMMSADTHMNEMLLIATKRSASESATPPPPPTQNISSEKSVLRASSGAECSRSTCAVLQRPLQRRSGLRSCCNRSIRASSTAAQFKMPGAASALGLTCARRHPVSRGSRWECATTISPPLPRSCLPAASIGRANAVLGISRSG